MRFTHLTAIMPEHPNPAMSNVLLLFSRAPIILQSTCGGWQPPAMHFQSCFMEIQWDEPYQQTHCTGSATQSYSQLFHWITRFTDWRHSISYLSCLCWNHLKYLLNYSFVLACSVNGKIPLPPFSQQFGHLPILTHQTAIPYQMTAIKMCFLRDTWSQITASFQATVHVA